MKLLIAIVSILFLFLPTAESLAQGFSVGLKGGLNFANQKIATVPSKISSNTGFHGGVAVAVALPGGLGFQVDGLFVSQSAEWEGTSAPTSGAEIRSKLQTLQVPVLLRMNIAFMNIHLGPQFNIILDGERSVDGTAAGKITENIKDDLKNGEFGFVIGVGAKLPANLNLTARYIIGLSDINDDPDVGEWKNSMMQVSLGYKLFGNK
jgi:hypothetical protein